MTMRTTLWVSIFINIVLLLVVIFRDETIIYENKVSLDQFFVGETIPELKSSHPGITFYYIFKYGNCPSCREEVFFINMLYHEFKTDIHFVGIMSYCGDDAMQERFLKGTGLKINDILFDNHFEKWTDYGFTSFPLKVICDSEGTILFADSTLYIPGDETGKSLCAGLKRFLKNVILNQKIKKKVVVERG